jgi:hypothetical protein
MSRSRSGAPRLSHFETRSVQLIAACALGLAGMASAHFASPARQGSTLLSTSRQGDAPRPARLNHDATASPSSTRR